MKALLSVLFLSLVITSAAAAQAIKCDMTQYKASTGLTAAIEQDLLVVTWAGQAGSEVRARYAIANGQPVVRDLAVRKQGGQWATLGQFDFISVVEAPDESTMARVSLELGSRGTSKYETLVAIPIDDFIATL